jgi:endo-1,4-beta-D-glucanase Y
MQFALRYSILRSAQFLVLATACSETRVSDVAASAPTGGDTSSATGGSATLGGNNGTGGRSNAGTTSSMRPTGGSAGVGGTLAGGVSATGGTASTGGSSSKATGGSNTGGATVSNVGGKVATGGSSSEGGKSNTGGSGGVAAGGTATGGAATGGAATGGASRGPTPPTSTANFPFPQNRQADNCIYPAGYDNEDVLTVYNAWKSALVSSQGVGSGCTNCRRVLRPAEPGLQVNSTVSEGIAYGMMIAVYMDDQSLFDDLWRYEQAHTWTSTPVGQPSVATSLMNWYIAADGSVASTSNGGMSGSGAATDADEDMAWALVMADKQWKKKQGADGSLGKTYSAYAQQLLKDIWTYEIDTYRLPKNGGGWGSDNCLNISYFAPAYYRVFANVAGEARWSSNVVPYVYQVISQSLNQTNGNQDNGLVPAFSTSTGGTDKCGTQGQSTQAHNYQYDSCRTPFRIGLDACFNNSTDAIAYVAKTSSFFAPKGANGIVDGYQLNGTNNAQFPGGAYNGLSGAFIGPAGVGAMRKQTGQNYQSFVDGVYNLLRQNNQWCGGQYYDESWTLLTLLMMTGNFLDYTKY